MPGTIRLLLVGSPGSEFRLAAEMARGAGAQVAMADTAADALALVRATGADLAMVDVACDVGRFLGRLSAERFALPVIACGIDAPAVAAVAAIRAGARDYVPLPPDRELIAAAIGLVAGAYPATPIGADAAFAQAIDYAVAMAPSRLPMLMTGEPGVGKETIARLVHERSGRTGPFVAVECAGLSAEILSSELFGHSVEEVAGAPEGRIGAITRAIHGTLFIRDIDRLPPALQARLMGHPAFGRAAANDDGGVGDVRILASTTHDLGSKVGEGVFRADLLARIAVARVAVPPLRDRIGDVATLAAQLIDRVATLHDLDSAVLSPEAEALLSAYDWPGNVRELEDVLLRALALARGPVIEAAHLVLIDGTRLANVRRRVEVRAVGVGDLVGRTVEDVERELILETLERCRGNRTTASNILGISVRTMRNKLRTFIETGAIVRPVA